MLLRPALESPIRIISISQLTIYYKIKLDNSQFLLQNFNIKIFQMKKQIVGFLTILSPLIIALFWSQNYQRLDSFQQQWEQYKANFGLNFNQQLQTYRQMIFSSNYYTIRTHNAQKSKSFEMGVNQFTHFLPSEFDTLFSSKRQRNLQQRQINSENKVQMTNQPNDIDWQKQGKVTPVKNQGTCDAGYAFCSNSLGQSYALMTNKPIALSEQQIVDCAQQYTTFGCSGGSRSGTLKFLQEKGVTTEAKYPWIGTKQTCKNVTSQFKLTQNIVTTNGCTELKNQLNVSPLTVAVNTTNWQFYKSGVLEVCGNEVNHDIFLVGFSEASWRLKNSWGVRWGEYGYVRIRMGDTCGICSKPGFGFKV